MKKVYLLSLFLFVQFSAGYGQNLEKLDELGKRKVLELKGSFSLSTNYYMSSRSQGNQRPFRYTVSGNPIFSVYGLDIPLGFTFANEDFSYSGPGNFQRIGLSPYYKWLKVHAGHRNVAFSPYTLNNHNFLGGGVELNPGKWRLGFVYGRFASAHVPDSSARQVLPPTYKRTGYAVKVGYGTESNYVDISMMHGKDDPNSIAEPEDFRITPKQNLTIGISTRQTIAKRLIFELQVGTSIFTEDIRLEELDLTEYEVPSFVAGLYPARSSTRLNFAGHTSLTYRQRAFSLKAEYKRIDPEYESMGSYYFNNDLERYTISPTFSLWQGKVNLGGSLGIQRDNLLENKSATTKRTIGSANVNIAPFPRFTLNAQYGNYATEQSSGLVNIDDTISVYQVNHNINITPTYLIAGSRYYHNFVLSLGRQMLQDRNLYTQQEMESRTRNANFNYRLRNNMQDYGLSMGLNYLSLDARQRALSRYGFSLGAEKDLFEEKLGLKVQATYNISERGEEKEGSLINGSFDLFYHFHPDHAFSVRTQAIINRTRVDYEDYIFSANYTFTL